ncbi:glycoside hydrolase family 130 protein [Zasmidium cellare ATCC 36951]|uniref:Glycoside hydrolase family 130 protein n=1 Tax=Zasmidium cellare ATCC 36951 TaxID=1080233 RepID=A0A6A6CBU1_ZASCE|nr:glycoside hydrolase family 130 protein [Zasmidium cellare ATCC 36951]KAF2164491.1 glycoside hydrolase family 130 protein [Zasmidium cellare ATCC 36951]
MRSLCSLSSILSVCAIIPSTTYPNISRNSTDGDRNYRAPEFPILGWTQYKNNPIMGPSNNSWESSYLFNPAAAVVDDKVFLLYRAQNESLISSIGLAWSYDGYNFTRYNQPVFFPTEPYERNGTEDPRLVRVNGTFYMTYTGFNGNQAVLCMATSENLVSWQKHGPILPYNTDVVYRPEDNYNRPREGWSKSGAIAPEKVNGLYQMQWGDSYLYTANSTDLINWNYTKNDIPFAQRIHDWEFGLMESAGALIKTRSGKHWIKFYNGVGQGFGGYKFGQYSTGQMLVDLENAPRGPPVARMELPILQPVFTAGQVSNVLFSEATVQFKGKWFMYYGEGDAYLGTATAPVQD